MPIGAVIGGAVASVGGAAISSSATGKAADKASAAAERSAELSAQVQRETYANNQKNLTPFMNTGNAAMGQINALLGLGDGTDWEGYVMADPAAYRDYNQNWSGGPNALGDMSLAEYGKFHYRNDLAYHRGDKVGNDGQQAADANANYMGRDLSQFSAQKGAERAFDMFRKSTGYDFRVGEGMNALNSSFAGRGVLQSGAVVKGAVDYGQGMASQEFGSYLGALGNQQALGMSGASALAGVGQSYANSLGNIYQQSGANQANAALARGQSGAQFGNALAGLGSQAIGYGLKPPTPSGGADAWYSPIAGGYR